MAPPKLTSPQAFFYGLFIVALVGLLASGLASTWFILAKCNTATQANIISVTLVKEWVTQPSDDSSRTTLVTRCHYDVSFEFGGREYKRTVDDSCQYPPPATGSLVEICFLNDPSGEDKDLTRFHFLASADFTSKKYEQQVKIAIASFGGSAGGFLLLTLVCEVFIKRLRDFIAFVKSFCGRRVQIQPTNLLPVLMPGKTVPSL